MPSDIRTNTTESSEFMKTHVGFFSDFRIFVCIEAKAMTETLSFKYLISNAQDIAWGMTVNSVGTQSIPAHYDSYPPKTGHPEDFYFDPKKGRVLDCYQILYITEGSGYYYIDPNKKIELKAGNMFILKPHVWHSYFPKKETGWKEYWIGIQGINIENRFKNNFFNPEQVVYKVGFRDDIVNLYEKALDIARKEKASYQQYLAGIANLILGIMMYSDRNRDFAVNELETRINKAKLLIRNNLTNDISLEDIASEINMSYSWFRKIFKEYTGFSPANYIKEMKLQRAKNLLISTDLSIKEIAYNLNFDSISYFSSTFRKQTGCTPLQYRMSIKMQ